MYILCLSIAAVAISVKIIFFSLSFFFISSEVSSRTGDLQEGVRICGTSVVQDK